MDCDFSHNPEDLPRLLEACEKGADVAIGSRYCKGGKVNNWPMGRIMMSYFASVYVRSVLWVPIKDTTAGFKCYRRKVLETIELDKIRFMGYAFQIEMKYEAVKKGFKVVEVPITFIDRVEGVSKMSTKIFKEAFWGVMQMRFKKSA
jgi:dolichol-phosphate mannosyltransferase